MKNIKISVQKYYCKFCGKEVEGGRGYLANPFCNDRQCYEERLEASGAIDLRNNHKVIIHDNNYVSIEPIDPNKKWKAPKRANN